MFSRALRRDIILLLCVKALALTALYFLFFSAKPVITPILMQQQLERTP